MVVLFHVLIHAALGAQWECWAWHDGAHREATSGGWSTVATAAALAWTAPLAAYQARLWPAYTFHYAYDPLLLPGVYQAAAWAAPIAILLYAAAARCGFAAAHAFRKRTRAGAASSVAFVLWAMAFGLAALDQEHLLCITDYANFWQGMGTQAIRHVHVVGLAAGYALQGIALGVAAARASRKAR